MDEKWLIKKRGFWYRPNACGYTKDITHAGLFEREKAQRLANVDGITIHRLGEIITEIDARRREIQVELDELRAFECRALGLREPEMAERAAP